MSDDLIKKYGFEDKRPEQTTALADAQGQKAIQEIQAALTVAIKHPRNESKSFERIMKTCERKTLAEQAIYVYPKGGQTVSGPSIRLAEALAQNWGNISIGIREVSQANGVSECEAFAWDLQTNYQVTKIFHVPHVRHTRKGSYKITDPREIYEMVANQGARRLRACVLAVIPGDIVDAAVEQCLLTQSSAHNEPIGQRIKKLIMAFSEIGVNVEHLEKRLGHNMDVTIEQELVTLRGIYKSIKDGMADRKDFFDFGKEENKSIEDLTKGKGLPTTEVIDVSTGEIKDGKESKETQS